MDQKTLKRLEELQGLIRQKEEIEARIARLLSPTPKADLPDDFSLNDEVLRLIQEKPEGISAKEILKELSRQYPSHGIDRQRISSSLAYLKNRKKLIETIGHGLYKHLKTTE